MFGKAVIDAAAHGLGRNGNPPPYRYQRRIDYLGRPAKRTARFRDDYLEVVRTGQRDGAISIRAQVVAGVVATASNNSGKDICFTEAWFAKQLHKVNGDTFSARYVSDGLDELRAAGFIDWEHGQTEQRFDEARRQMLGGRWQGAATYRLLIPLKYQQQLDERREASRARRRGPGRVTPTPADTGRAAGRERRLSGRQAAILADVNRLTGNADSFQQAADRLANVYRAAEYEFAYDELTRLWASRGSP